MPNIRECRLTSKSENDSCIIVGDLSGSLSDLHYLCREFGSETKVIYNGNFMRNNDQIEVLLRLCVAFIKRPAQVFLNRGACEDMAFSLVDDTANGVCSLLKLTRQKYGQYSAVIFSELVELFGCLSLGTLLVNEQTRMFVVSSGFSSEEMSIELIQSEVKRSEILMSDHLARGLFDAQPRPNGDEEDREEYELESEQRLASECLEFGQEQTAKFCKLSKFMIMMMYVGVISSKKEKFKFCFPPNLVF